MGMFTPVEQQNNTPTQETTEETTEVQSPADNVTTEEVTEEVAPVADLSDELTTTNQRLHTALVALDGRLANPADLPFNPDHLTDESALAEAITNLVASNPALKKNHVAGDVGQGARGESKKSHNLIDLLRMA